MSPAQCRAGRTLLLWSVIELGSHAGVSPSTVVNYENGLRKTNASTIRVLQQALEAAGVEFFASGTGDPQEQPPVVAIHLADGSGARLAHAQATGDA